MMSIEQERGSAISLVVLLVSLAIIGFLFVRYSVAPSSSTELNDARNALATTSVPETPPTTALEAGRRDIESAKAIQTQLNLHNMDINNSFDQ